MQTDIRNLTPETRELVLRAGEARSQLSDTEAWWRDKQVFLQSTGYMLRPRYRPGWVPAWTLPANEYAMPDSFEDYHNLPLRIDPGIPGIDARRIADNRLVFLKAVHTNGPEYKIATLLSQESAAQDPRNHAVPLLDYFPDQEDPSISYIVMPYLHIFDRPPFETVADVVDFIDQILEGLTYLHEKGITHQDCVYTNIMMDADALFPEGFHPVVRHFDVSLSHHVAPLSRAGIPIRYYYIDFGLSTHFSATDERLVVGTLGRDRSPPELSHTVKYDPFPLDIYLIGNTFRKHLWEKYSNVSFMLPLIQKMTAKSPASRPTAAEAQKEWMALRQDVSDLHRQWRLHSREEMWVATIVYDSIFVIVKGAQLSRRILDWLSDLQG